MSHCLSPHPQLFSTSGTCIQYALNIGETIWNGIIYFALNFEKMASFGMRFLFYCENVPYSGKFSQEKIFSRMCEIAFYLMKNLRSFSDLIKPERRLFAIFISRDLTLLALV